MTTLALGLIACLAQGCGNRSCTAVDRTEGLTVRVTSDEPLTSGDYRFVAEIPGETFELNLTLEEPKNTQQGVYVSQRLERGTWQVNASLSGSSELGTSGELSIGRFKGETGGPKSLSLTVLQDNAEIGALELGSIDYDQEEINGPGCGVSESATATISIAPVQ